MEIGISEATTPLFGHYIVYDEVTEIIDGGNGGKTVQSYEPFKRGSYDGMFIRSMPQVRRFENSDTLELQKEVTDYVEGAIPAEGTGANPNQIKSIRWLRPSIKLVPDTYSSSVGTVTEYDTLYHSNSGLYETLWIHPIQKVVEQNDWEFIPDPPCEGPYEPGDPCTEDDSHYEKSDSLRTIVKFVYGDPTHKQLTEQIRINSTGDTLKTFYRYAHEEYAEMEFLYMIQQPYSITAYDSIGNLLKQQWLLWDKDGSGKWRPCEQWIWNGETDEQGNPLVPDPTQDCSAGL